jgi:hypothetical protein
MFLPAFPELEPGLEVCSQAVQWAQGKVLVQPSIKVYKQSWIGPLGAFQIKILPEAV